MNTHILYKGRKPNTTELQTLFPLLEITSTPFKGEMKTVIEMSWIFTSNALMKNLMTFAWN